MNSPHPTIVFKSVVFDNAQAIRNTASERGYSLTHLLAAHSVNNTVIDFYFSTELIRVSGNNLRPLWDALSKGARLDPSTSSQITQIKVVSYNEEPFVLSITPEE